MLFQKLCQVAMFHVIGRSVVDDMLEENNIAGVHSTCGVKELSWNGGCGTSAPHAHGRFRRDLNCHKGREPTLVHGHANFIRQFEHEHTHPATVSVTCLAKNCLRQDIWGDQIADLLSGIKSACKVLGIRDGTGARKHARMDVGPPVVSLAKEEPD
jgi:hypothetical protein